MSGWTVIRAIVVIVISVGVPLGIVITAAQLHRQSAAEAAASTKIESVQCFRGRVRSGTFVWCPDKGEAK